MLPIECLAVAAALLYPLFLLAEKAALAKARSSIRLVVHVNGTRGKTETTRLIAAAFRAGGLRTLAKTTGTLPLLIMPDGSERVIRRMGSPNVREQRNLLLLGARLHVEAVVAECMAVSPDAQAASHAFLEPSVLVVTNSRPDHGDELGEPGEAAKVFAQGCPKGGEVFTSDAAILGILAAAAEVRGGKATLAPPVCGTCAIMDENAGIALLVAEYAGIPRERALKGMGGYKADPGAFAIRRLGKGSSAICVVDALSANDPVSTELLFGRADIGRLPGGRRVLLLANRSDRADRCLAFARWAAAEPERWDEVLVAGRPSVTAWRLLEAAFGTRSKPRRSRGQGPAPAQGRLRTLRRLEELLDEGPGTTVFAVGNWKQLGPSLAGLERKGQA